MKLSEIIIWHGKPEENVLLVPVSGPVRVGFHRSYMKTEIITGMRDDLFLTLKRPLYDPLKREMQSISETVKLIPDMTLSDNEAKVYDLIGHIYPSKLALSGHIFMNHMNDIKSGKAVLTVTCSAREGALLVHETYKCGLYNSCRIYSLYLLIRRKIRSDGKYGAFVIWSREEESKLQKCN